MGRNTEGELVSESISVTESPTEPTAGAGQIAHGESPAGGTAWNTWQAKLLVVLAVTMVWWLLRVIFFEGFHGSDDFAYLRFAHFWDHQPQNHWEARLVYNSLLRLSLMLFGTNEVAAAIPTLLGSLLTFGAVLLFAWNSPKPIRTLWIAGMLGASLPGMVYCTTPNARPLAIGFFSMALAVLLLRKDRKSALIAGGLFGLGVASHLSMLYCTGIALLAVPFGGGNRWRNTLLAGAAMLAAFALADILVYALWTGDPFYRFNIIAATHMTNLDFDPNARELWKDGGGLSMMFFVRPVRDLIISKSFVLLLGLAMAWGVLRWRRFSPQSRSLLLVLCLSWLWQSYGSQSPTAYKPFPGTTPYWGGLILPGVVLAAGLLCGLGRTVRLIGITAFLVAANLAILSLSGPWGQSVDVSRKFLPQLAAEGGGKNVAFVSDDRTIRELVVINGFRRPANLFRAPDSPGHTLVNVPALDKDALVAGRTRLLVNTLNFRGIRNNGEAWVRAHCGEEVYRGDPQYRLLTYMLPETYRRKHSWTLRRPAARIHRANLLPTEKVR